MRRKYKSIKRPITQKFWFIVPVIYVILGYVIGMGLFTILSWLDIPSIKSAGIIGVIFCGVFSMASTHIEDEYYKW